MSTENQPQGKNESQADITMSNVDEILDLINMQMSILDQVSLEGLPSMNELVQYVRTCSKALNVIKKFNLTTNVEKLATAIRKRTEQLQQPLIVSPPAMSVDGSQDDQAQQEQRPKSDMSKPIEYKFLFQYVSDLDQQSLSQKVGTLSPAAQYQQQRYVQPGLIDRTKRSQNGNLPFDRLFVGIPRRTMNLSKDQCNQILIRINPQKNHYGTEFPQFNPDFQFSQTVFAIKNSQDFNLFQGFVEPHRTSQLALHKDLSIYEVEGRFAFEQSCRWIQMKMDSTLNLEWNERIAFYYANDCMPTEQNSKFGMSRVSLARCMDTGAWDGIHTYFFCPTAFKMGRVFNQLKHLSPILTEGKFSINILDKSQLPVEMASLPPPHRYEQLLPLHSSWCNLNYNQLTKPLQERFSPCILYGGTYQPNYASSNYGVTGKLISTIPRFSDVIPQEQHQDLFVWSIEQGKWEKKKTEIFSARDKYLNFSTPTQTDQQSQHEQTKIFVTQVIDTIEDREYGSNHFWTHYNRHYPRNQITRTPMSVYSEYSAGENPFKPKFSQISVIDKLSIPTKELSTDDLQDCFHIYLDQAVLYNAELALRYRRAQIVMGYNSPYLTYKNMVGRRTQYQRVSSINEFISRPLRVNELNIIRTSDTSSWQWIPRQLVPYYDETTSQCRTRKQMAYLRWEQIDSSKNQPNEWQTVDHSRDDIKSPNKKKLKYTKK